MFSLFMSHPAHAGGAVGGSGSGGGGGGNGAPDTDYGYGWYKFNTNGQGTGTPQNMKSGSWPSVQNDCAAAGADTITAFIVLRPARTPQSAEVFDYTDRAHKPGDWYGTYNLYKGDSGGNWQSYGNAQNAFNALSAQNVDTSGFTFGSNVAYFCSDFQPKNWNITPDVSINQTSAQPGDTLHWTHTITNNGDATTSTVSYGYSPSGRPFKPGSLVKGQVSSSGSYYTVTQGDVGNTLCRATYADPKSNTDSGMIESGAVCANVPYNYTLTPTITTDLGGSASVGTVVNVSPAVTNSGPTKSKSTDWLVTQFVVSPGKAVPNSGGGTSNSGACDYFKTNVASCASPYNSDNGTTTFNESASGSVSNNKTPLAGTSYTMADLTVGSRVCFALSVKPYNSGTGTNWRHSAPICIVISKSPLVQILGGDLRVGNGFVGSSDATSQINTRVTVKTDKSYGSWTEYGVIASGTVSGMASGSAYSGGLSCTINCSTNTISFANSPAVGNFKPTTKIPDVAASFATTTATPNFVSLSDATQRRVETANGNITIGGGTIARGDWLVINAPTRTVTITGDITYDGSSLSSIGEIPQLVIIADQINIEGNVKNVDAWLIASGSNGIINTCTKWSGAAVAQNARLTSTICSDPLTINGPVMAKKLYLHRTAGAGAAAQSGDPAEVINLRPDAYLWAIAQASKSARLETTYTKELPPRF